MQAAARSTLLAYPVGGEEDWLGKQVTPTVPMPQLEAPFTMLDLRLYNEAGAQVRPDAARSAPMFASEHSAVSTLLGAEELGSQLLALPVNRFWAGDATTSSQTARGLPPDGVRYGPVRNCGLLMRWLRARPMSMPELEGLNLLPLS